MSADETKKCNASERLDAAHANGAHPRWIHDYERVHGAVGLHALLSHALLHDGRSLEVEDALGIVRDHVPLHVWVSLRPDLQV